MAYRGRGRGGGGGGGRGGYGGFGGMGHAKPAPVVLFPDVTLPGKPAISAEDKFLIGAKIKLQNYWKSSPYYIEAPSEKSQSVDIERFSDKGKPKRHRRRDNLEAHLKISSFPIELHDVLLGKRGPKQRAPKKARTSVGAGLEKLDMLEKLEQEGQNKDASDKPKKEEDEDEEEEDEEEEDAEYSDDGDYNQNEYFDDDEDDYNDAAGGSDHDDEPLLA